jgi:heme oxygenase
MTDKPRYTFTKDEYDESYNIFENDNYIGCIVIDVSTIEKFIHAVNTRQTLVDALDRATAELIACNNEIYAMYTEQLIAECKTALAAAKGEQNANPT